MVCEHYFIFFTNWVHKLRSSKLLTLCFQSSWVMLAMERSRSASSGHPDSWYRTMWWLRRRAFSRCITFRRFAALIGSTSRSTENRFQVRSVVTFNGESVLGAINVTSRREPVPGAIYVMSSSELVLGVINVIFNREPMGTWLLRNVTVFLCYRIVK